MTEKICPNCEHLKGGVEEDCPCGRVDRHPRCNCECHEWKEESK